MHPGHEQEVLLSEVLERYARRNAGSVRTIMGLRDITARSVRAGGRQLSARRREADLTKGILKTWRADGVPTNVPLMNTESNVSWGLTQPMTDIFAALWLAEREIAALGADNFAVEVIPFAQGTVFPVHQRLIRDFGIPLLEGLLLHELVAMGRHEFLFVASPLPVVGGTGSPINPIAIL